MLKNMMEERQLDFNQPLLSVRRSSAPVISAEAEKRRNTDKPLPKLPPLPVYKSELKSGPVRNPGTVPFVWEQIPGRPKDERVSPYQALEHPPPSTPKLPPGRVVDVKKQTSDKRSKRTTTAKSQAGNELSVSQNASNLDSETVTEYDRSKKGMEDKDTTGSEDGDETYLDALSRTESCYMNCSVSGLSGLDGPNIKPSGTFSTDPVTQDFMMGRFLPAAKAMASETPQYSSRKQSAAHDQTTSQQQPRGMKTVVNGNQQRSINQFRSNDVPRKLQDRTRSKSEDEEIRAQLPVSSVRRVHAKSYPSSYRKARNEYAGGDAFEQILMDGYQGAWVPEDKTDLPTESNQITKESDCLKLGGSPVYRRGQGVYISPYRNECSIHNEEKGFLGIPEKNKNSGEAIGYAKYRRGQHNFRELLATETGQCGIGSGSPVVEKTVYVDSIHTVKSPSSSLRSSDTKGSVDCKWNDLEIPYKSHEVEETPSLESSFQDIEQLGDVNEKAIILLPKYLEFPDSRLVSCSDRLNKDVPTDMRDGPRQNQDLIQDFNNLGTSKVADREQFNLKSQQLEKSVDLESFDGLTQDIVPWKIPELADVNEMDTESQQFRNSSQETFHGHAQNSITLTSSKVHHKMRIDLDSQRIVKFGNQESAHGYNSQLPLGLPLPKSPSESWLKRMLPSISSRSSSSDSSPGARNFTSSQASKTSSLDPKWETIVKSSNRHHGHLRFSEEILTPIPEA